MKRILLVLMVITSGLFVKIFAQPSSWPSSGDGSAENPYTIQNLANLRWIAENSGRWNKHYVQTNDIDASETGEGGYYGLTGWLPIGNATIGFTGSYNGNGKTISGLYSNLNFIVNGLFGSLHAAIINNLSIVNANIKGLREVGILAGYCGQGCKINGCFTSGSVTAETKVGGLIGWLDHSTIQKSGSSAMVLCSVATHEAGGFVAYCTGTFTISDCYSTGSVNGVEWYGGGFVGRIQDQWVTGRIKNCFSTGYVNNQYGGFAGDITGYPPINCFWDRLTSMADFSAGGTGKTTGELKSNIAIYTNVASNQWDFIGNYYSDAGTEEIWNLDGTTNNGYPFLSWQTHAWTGQESTDWNDPDNWLSGAVPNVSNTVSISLATENPVLYEESASCKDLIISIFPSENEKVLTILGGHLTVLGSLINNGDEDNLILELEPGYAWGTLIHNTPDVKAKFTHTINAAQWETWDDGWHLLSCPASGSPIDEWHTPGTGQPLEGDFYSWNEASDQWINRTLEGGVLNPEFETSFISGKGYLVAVKNSISEYFHGNLNATDVVTPLLTHNTDGWNLVGNPFPCSIKWNDGNWDLDGFGSVAQVWEEISKDYVPLQANDIIPPCQGFMIYLDDGSKTLTIPKAARTHEWVTWYKQGKENQRIELIACDSAGASYKKTVIKKDADATSGFDLEYDAFYLGGFAPQFFSIAGENKLTVNTLPEINEETVIPLGFVKNGSTDFSIELTEKIDELPLVLIDTKTGTEHDFSNGGYNFTSTESDPVNRFFLKFGHVGINESPCGNAIEAWVDSDILFVGQQAKLMNLEIFTIDGKCIQTMVLQNEGLKKVSLSHLVHGFYLIRLSGNNESKTIKVKI